MLYLYFNEDNDMNMKNDAYTLERNIIEKEGKLDVVSFHVSDKKNKTEQWFSIRRRDDTVVGDCTTLPNIQVALKNNKSDDTMFIEIPMEKSFERNMGTIDGLMHVYYKVSHNASLATVEQRSAVLDFMDKYFFNTSDNRDVLNTYMQSLEQRRRPVLTHADEQKDSNILITFMQKLKSWRGK